MDTSPATFSDMMEMVLVGLLISGLAIFGWLAAISRSPRTFQFQISVFILIWIGGELADMVLGDSVLSLPGLGGVGSFIHLGAMVFFAAMIWLRFVTARSKGKKLEDDDAKSSGYLIDR